MPSKLLRNSETDPKEILIRRMVKDDTGLFYATPEVTGDNRQKGLYETYYQDQENGSRVVLLAFYYQIFAGYVTIIRQSEYIPFSEKGIPEINDLCVHRRFRRRGIATALLDEAEKIIFKQSPLAGIAVGLYKDYGPAQILYTLRRYIPDGLGIMYKEQPVIPGKLVKVDDDLLLFLVKVRPAG